MIIITILLFIYAQIIFSLELKKSLLADVDGGTVR